jgi:hypothetical protein
VGISLFASQSVSDVSLATRSAMERVGRMRAGVATDQRTWLVVGLTVCAAALRMVGITDKSIWYDEAFVITLGQMSIPDMLSALINLDPHPPLFYLLMHFWMVLGTDPLMVRLPSALLSTLTVPLLYATGTRLAGKDIALGGAVLLSVSPFHVSWAQEVRMYSLLGFVCLASAYFLVKAVQEGGRRNWVAVSLLTAAALYTQINAAFYVAAQALGMLALLVSGRCPRSNLAPWMKSQVGAALLFLPWVPAFMIQSEVYGDPGLVFTTLRGLEGLLFRFGYDNLPYWHLPGDLAPLTRSTLVLGSLGLTFLGAWSLRRGVGGVLLLFLFAGSVGLLALAGLWRSILLPKTMLPASFAYYLLLVAGLIAMRRRALVVGGLLVLVFLNSAGMARYYTTASQEDWHETVTYLGKQFRPGEVALVDCSAGLMPLNYYLSQEHVSVEAHGVPFRPWAVAPPPLNDEDYKRVDEISRGRPAVWLLVYRNGFQDEEGQLLPYLASRYSLSDTRTMAKIRMYRFVPKVVRTPLPAKQALGGSVVALQAGPTSPIVGATSGTYLGAWVGERVNQPGNVSQFESAIGKGLAIAHRYSDNPPYHGRQFDSDWATSARAAGSIPMLSWQPGFGQGTSSLTSVAAGDRDDYLTAWADQFKGWGHPIFLRMMWEQNGPWFAWKAYQEPQIADFVQAWRHIVDLFRARGVSNVTFVWSPHVSGAGGSEVMASYPGDDYVDWVALDGYPFRGGRGDFTETFGPDYDILVEMVPKPIMIAETSLESWSDDQKATWITEILSRQLPQRFPMVKALVWFDEKNTDGIDYSILQDEGPRSQEAFRQAVASTYFAGNGYGTIETTPIPPPGSGAAPSSGPMGNVETATRSGIEHGNLIVDPGFEEGGETNGWNPAWVVPPWLSGVVRRDAGSAISGSYSMLHSSAGGESYAVHQDVPVVAGATYDLSVAVRVDAPIQYGKATLEVQSLNQYGGVVETRSLAVWQDSTDGWVRVGGNVKVARGASKARVQLRVTSLRGSFRLDDFIFTRSAT